METIRPTIDSPYPIAYKFRVIDWTANGAAVSARIPSDSFVRGAATDGIAHAARALGAC
jgi:hypothetical protein